MLSVWSCLPWCATHPQPSDSTHGIPPSHPIAFHPSRSTFAANCTFICLPPTNCLLLLHRYHVLPRHKREEIVEIVEKIGKGRVFNGENIRVMDDDEFIEIDSY